NMSLTNKHIILLALFISLGEATIAFSSRDQTKFYIHSTVYVRVSNSLDDGAEFTIHCKSKNDDVGTHVIPAGQSYTLSFHPNFWGTTLFFCGITSPEGSVEFVLYDFIRDFMRCENECDWTVSNMGVSSNTPGGFYFLYGWPKP
ncbi:Self-incomp_S1 domain-containing protein, partial [Cephalotus follicularis]